ncbi:MAG: hypothetical protein HQ527_02195 [Cyanobacteria bacterium]|nr:hypothetical protein [Cyanobacteria bacterium bin.51]
MRPSPWCWAAPALQRCEPNAQQSGDRTGSCPSRHGGFKDLEDLAAICSAAASPKALFL